MKLGGRTALLHDQQLSLHHQEPRLPSKGHSNDNDPKMTTLGRTSDTSNAKSSTEAADPHRLSDGDGERQVS